MTRRQLLRLLAAAPALAVTGCTAQSASSQQEKPLILRYAENQPEDYPTSKAAKAFAELVAQRTDGRVKVLVYSGAELGAEQSVIQQMQFGGVDFSRVSLSQLAEYEPELSVLQLPYLYSDAQQMWRVLDGGIGDEFLASPAVMEKLAALDESFPEVIRACARESAQTERELWARREANAEQNMRKRGICVTELDEAEKARFRAAVQPMYDRFRSHAKLIQRIRES